MEQSTERSLMKTCSRALRTTQVSQCPWVAQPPNRTSLERLENSSAATLPIQLDRAWEDLERMGETPQIQVCQACSVIPKKTQGCNRCQMCFNKVLSKGSEYLCDISVYIMSLRKQKGVIMFFFSLNDILSELKELSSYSKVSVICLQYFCWLRN